MSSIPYVQFYPSDFLAGIAGLTPDEIAVYTVVLMLIYDSNGSVREDIDALSWRVRMRRDRCRKVIDELVSRGKLDREDGLLCNKRAEKEIEKRRVISQKQSKTASTRWKKQDENASNINESSMPRHSHGNANQNQNQNHIPDKNIDRGASEDGSTNPSNQTGSSDDGKQPAPSSSSHARQKRQSKSTKTRLPDGWALTEADRAYAVGKGLSLNRISHEAEKFKAHFLGAGTKYERWDMVWQRWVLRNLDGPSWRGQQPAQRTKAESAIDGMEQMFELMERHDEVRGNAGSGEVRLLTGPSLGGYDGDDGNADSGGDIDKLPWD